MYTDLEVSSDFCLDTFSFWMRVNRWLEHFTNWVRLNKWLEHFRSVEKYKSICGLKVCEKIQAKLFVLYTVYCVKE